MFLDDELLKIAHEADVTNQEGVYDATEKMLHACFANYIKRTGNNKDDKTIISQLRRVNRTWEEVIDKLESENIFIARRDGFKTLLTSKSKELGKYLN